MDAMQATAIISYLQADTSKGIDIASKGGTTSVDDLWGQPSYRTTNMRPQTCGRGISELRQPEVGQLHMELTINQNIRLLDGLTE